MSTDGQRHLGDYRILESIGGGGMGWVYRAEHRLLRMTYALKVLSPELYEREGFVERFRDEALVMAQLRHPNIVEVHNMSRQEGRYFLVMDYVAGPEGKPTNLKDVLLGAAKAGRRRIRPARVRKWAVQIAEALAYAHGRGVIHRDVKPANVLLDAAGNVRLADFGLAKLLGEDFLRRARGREGTDKSLSDSQTIVAAEPAQPGDPLGLGDWAPDDDSLDRDATRPAGVGPAGAGDSDRLDASATVRAGSASGTGSGSSASEVVGTYDYMSPEQRQGGQVDGRTDLFSFGVLVYQLLTGAKPVGSVRPPTKVVPGLHAVWDRVWDRCAAPSPEDRYRSAEALLADLRQVPDESAFEDQAERARELIAAEAFAEARDLAEGLLARGPAGKFAEPLLAELSERAERLCEAARGHVESGDLKAAGDCVVLAKQADPACQAVAGLSQRLEWADEVSDRQAEARQLLAYRSFGKARAVVGRLEALGQLGAPRAQEVAQGIRRRLRLEAEQLCDIAKRALRRGRVNEARETLDRVLKIDPALPEAVRLADQTQNVIEVRDAKRGLLAHLDAAEYARARQAFDRLEALGPRGKKSAQAVATRMAEARKRLVRRAQEAARDELTEEALLSARAALQLYPDDAELRKLVADAELFAWALPLRDQAAEALEARQYEQVRRLLEQLERAQPIGPRYAMPLQKRLRAAAAGLLNSAGTLAAAGQWHSAREDVREALRIQPDLPEARELLQQVEGEIERRRRQYRIARTAAAWSIKIGVGIVACCLAVWALRGCWGCVSGWSDRPVPPIPDPEQVRFKQHLARAQGFLRDGKITEAAAAIKQALTLRPDDGVALGVKRQIDARLKPDAVGYVPATRFGAKSGLELDLGRPLDLKAVLRHLSRNYDVTGKGDHLLWHTLGIHDDWAYLTRDGKVIILSKRPISSLEDRDRLALEAVLVTTEIAKVIKDVKPFDTFAMHNPQYYSAEEGVYKALVVWFRREHGTESVIVGVPDCTVKSARMFVPWAGNPNRSVTLGTCKCSSEKTTDITGVLLYGQQELRTNYMSWCALEALTTPGKVAIAAGGNNLERAATQNSRQVADLMVPPGSTRSLGRYANVTREPIAVADARRRGANVVIAAALGAQSGLELNLGQDLDLGPVRKCMTSRGHSVADYPDFLVWLGANAEGDWAYIGKDGTVLAMSCRPLVKLVDRDRLAMVATATTEAIRKVQAKVEPFNGPLKHNPVYYAQGVGVYKALRLFSREHGKNELGRVDVPVGVVNDSRMSWRGLNNDGGINLDVDRVSQGASITHLLTPGSHRLTFAGYWNYLDLLLEAVTEPVDAHICGAYRHKFLLNRYVADEVPCYAISQLRVPAPRPVQGHVDKVREGLKGQGELDRHVAQAKRLIAESKLVDAAEAVARALAIHPHDAAARLLSKQIDVWRFQDAKQGDSQQIRIGGREFQWRILRDQWIIEDNSAYVTQVTRKESRDDLGSVVLGGIDAKDYIFRVKLVNRGRSFQDFGVIFRAVDENNFYYLSLYWKGVSVRRNDRWNRTPIASFAGDISNSMVEVRLKGPSIKVYADGKPIMDFQDKTFSHGKVGLRTYTHTDGGFRDMEQTVEVKVPEAPISSPVTPTQPVTDPDKSAEEILWETKMAMGRKYADRGEWDKALACFTEAGKIRPGSEVAQAINETQYHKYMGLGREAMVKDNKAALANFRLARKHKDTKAVQDLIAKLEGTSPPPPPVDIAYNKWMKDGQAYVGKRLWTKARACFQKAKDLHNTQEVQAALLDTRYQENLAMGRKAMAQDPRGALSYFKLARGFKDTEEVRELIKQAEQKVKARR